MCVTTPVATSSPSEHSGVEPAFQEFCLKTPVASSSFTPVMCVTTPCTTSLPCEDTGVEPAFPKVCLATPVTSSSFTSGGQALPPCEGGIQPGLPPLASSLGVGPASPVRCVTTPVATPSPSEDRGVDHSFPGVCLAKVRPQGSRCGVVSRLGERVVRPRPVGREAVVRRRCEGIPDWGNAQAATGLRHQVRDYRVVLLSPIRGRWARVGLHVSAGQERGAPAGGRVVQASGAGSTPSVGPCARSLALGECGGKERQLDGRPSVEVVPPRVVTSSPVPAWVVDARGRGALTH